MTKEIEFSNSIKLSSEAEVLKDLDRRLDNSATSQDNNTLSNSPIDNSIDYDEGVPKTLGRYRILEKVGQGATAVVYRAYDPQLDRFLAIKLLRDYLAKDKDYRKNFIQEAKLAAQLTHPNIVTIYDVGITDHKAYIAMELIEGKTLEAILKASQKLSVPAALAMTRQLASALQYAHEQGVVHRDIKPGNILVLADTKTVKLADFGIAQLEESLVGTGKLSDKVMGTPEYMSPEQVLGHPLDSRSDLYSVGVLLYQMINGKPPFCSDDLANLFKRIIKTKSPSFSVENYRIKDDLNDLVRKLLHKRPAKRYQKAAELCLEIDRINRKIDPKNKIKKQGFSSLTTRWTATMAGTVFLSMCVGLVIVAWMQYRALSGITFDYGASIARMIAYQSSEPLLDQDAVGLQALAKDAASNEALKMIVIANNQRKVLARVGSKVKTLTQPDADEMVKEMDGMIFYERKSLEGERLYDLYVRVKFADKPVGYLMLSYSREPILQASSVTLSSMLILMLVTLFIVSIVGLRLARQTATDFRRVSLGLKKLVLGRTDTRINSKRNDEAKHLFEAFNRTSVFVEATLEKNKKYEHMLKRKTARKRKKTVEISKVETQRPISQDDVETIQVTVKKKFVNK